MRIHVLVIGMALLMGGCGHDATISSLTQYDRATLEMKYQTAYVYVQDLSCTSQADCDTIAIGAKPCGGARGYLVYSKVTVDVNKLQDIVADVSQYEAGYNAQEGIILQPSPDFDGTELCRPEMHRQQPAAPPSGVVRMRGA